VTEVFFDAIKRQAKRAKNDFAKALQSEFIPSEKNELIPWIVYTRRSQ
jgi:hypothetical protein